jgi:hypothetical protein
MTTLKGTHLHLYAHGQEMEANLEADWKARIKMESSTSHPDRSARDAVRNMAPLGHCL